MPGKSPPQTTSPSKWPACCGGDTGAVGGGGGPGGLVWKESTFPMDRECLTGDEKELVLFSTYDEISGGLWAQSFMAKTLFKKKKSRVYMSGGGSSNAGDRKEEKWVMCAKPRAAG